MSGLSSRNPVLATIKATDFNSIETNVYRQFCIPPFLLTFLYKSVFPTYLKCIGAVMASLECAAVFPTEGVCIWYDKTLSYTNSAVQTGLLS